MTSAPEESLQVGDRLPSLDLPLDPRWHDENRTGMEVDTGRETDTAGGLEAGRRDHEGLPSIQELVDWVDYLGTQCPECGVLDTTDRSWRAI